MKIYNFERRMGNNNVGQNLEFCMEDGGELNRKDGGVDQLRNKIYHLGFQRREYL